MAYEIYTYSFERLQVWVKSKTFIKELYDVTSKFPETEKFGLVNQMRRSAISIASNIAEGAGRKSKKEQNQYYTVAYSSLLENLNQIIISNELGLINQLEYEILRKKIEEISRMLNGLRNSNS